MPATGRREPRPLRPQARPVRVEARRPVHRQRGHRFFAPAPGEDAALLQRDRVLRPPRGRLAPVPVPRPGEDHPVRDRHARVREVHRAHRGRGDEEAVRAVVVVDGEHYAPVVRAALETLPYEVVGLFLAGGTEKLRGGEEYGVPFVEDFEGAEIVVDLSDEPVLGPERRLQLASRVLAAGLSYVGADFRFDPPAFEPFGLPWLAVIGTGKRVGKSAVTAHGARALARGRDVVVVAMGRGGPPEPEVIEVQPTVESLLALSRVGLHAASDHLETAALAGVVT